MTAQQRAWSWGLGLVVFVGLFYLLRGVMLPFIAGMAVAYFLDPACDWLERKGASRTLATIFISVGFFLLVALIIVLLVPLVYSQLVDLVQKFPGYLSAIRAKLLPLIAGLEPLIGEEGIAQLRGALSEHGGDAIRWLGRVLGGVLTSIEAVFNLVSLLVITPIVSFYLLRDWDRLVATVDGWLPRAHADTIREQLAKIDETLAGFVRGQVTVCILLGLFYGIGLTLVGLESGFVVGFGTGLVSFVPYFGMLIGFAVGIVIAIVQFGDPVSIGLVAAVFLVGQFIEGNFVTPNLVGERIGLHPVWVIFALLAGGALFGFVGILIAVPTAAVIGVLLRFSLDRYLESPLYLHAAPDGSKAAGEDGDAPS
ncbi:MAG: AI-2E family transporter [Rhodospirillales bacterium]|nr:MAG: AI-2E family transporter [Rhodospirillales bacterium]